MQDNNPLTAKAQYQKLEEEREPYLQRARECAELTIPFLVPPEGDNHTTNYPTPHQSVGSRGVNNLASKLLVSLFPPNSPFTKHVIDEYQFKQAAPVEAEEQEDFKTELENALADIDRALMREIETSASRPTFYETLRHLLVAGNGLLYMPSKGGLKLFHLDRYVVKRNPMGHVLDIIVKEAVSPTTLPKAVQQSLEEYKDSEEERKSVDLYTRIVRKDEESDWESWQEVNDTMIPGTYGKFPKDKVPWIALRFSKIDGASYGRSYVEEYLGDLSMLEGFMKAIYEGTTAATKVIILVHPNGQTRKVDLMKAENGAIIDGIPEEVAFLQSEKQADMQIGWSAIQELTQRLSRAFLLTESVQRDAERVTAEEIRVLIAQLDAAIGGIHALFAQEFQLPIANLFKDRMTKQKRLPELPKDIVKPQVVTGIEAIGRGNDFQKLRIALGALAETLGPEVAQQIIKPLNVGNKVFVAAGVDDDGIIKSQEEWDQVQQQNQMQQLIERLGPNFINQMGAMIQNQQGEQATE